MIKTVKDLLEQAMERHDVRSGRALAELTKGREHTIDRTQVNHLLAGTYKSELRPSTIRAIAWLAGVDEAEAFDAAGRPIPGPPLSHELPPGTDYLNPSQRDAVITVIRAFLSPAEQEEVMGNAKHPAPIEPPVHPRMVWIALQALERASGLLGELELMKNVWVDENEEYLNRYLTSRDGRANLDLLLGQLANALDEARGRTLQSVAALDDPEDPPGSAHE